MRRAPDCLMGFKALNISREGALLSPREYAAWDERGVFIAQCALKKSHSVVPDEYCSCGVYAAFKFLACAEYTYRRGSLFVIKGFGKCVVAENGFRAELAQVAYIVKFSSWCGRAIYEQIASPRPPCISLELADAAIRERRAQWLTGVEDESRA